MSEAAVRVQLPLREEPGDLAEVIELHPPVPRLRGVSHEKAFAFAPAVGVLLVASAHGTAATLAAAAYACAMTAMLGVSAFNHRGVRPAHWAPWLRRLDHTAVNTSVACTWLAMSLLVLPGPLRLFPAAVVVAGAVAASLVTILWVEVPGWIPATILLVSAWSCVVAFPALAERIGAGGLALFVVGGVLYSAGGVVYALRRPNPFPATAGYHEIFHALVVAGAACHTVTYWLFVLPEG